MSYNGSGVFQINSAGQPVVSGTDITDTAFNALTADLATGLSTALTKDGQSTITQNLPFNDKKITGLGAGTARTDAASLATIQDGTGVFVDTAGVGGTADVVTLTPSPAIPAYVAGQTVRWIASGTNTGAMTVATSGLVAKALTKNGAVALIAGDVPSGSMITATYDGTRYILGTPGRNFATLTGTETLTNKTLTAPAVSAPVLSGTITGTYTLGGTPTIPGALTAGTTLTRNPVVVNTLSTTGHNLGVTPVMVHSYIECLVAELGYEVGDQVSLQGGGTGWLVSSGAVDISIVVSGAVQVINRTTPAGYVTITTAKWKVVVVPYRLT